MPSGRTHTTNIFWVQLRSQKHPEVPGEMKQAVPMIHWGVGPEGELLLSYWALCIPLWPTAPSQNPTPYWSRHTPRDSSRQGMGPSPWSAGKGVGET